MTEQARREKRCKREEKVEGENKDEEPFLILQPAEFAPQSLLFS